MKKHKIIVGILLFGICLVVVFLFHYKKQKTLQLRQKMEGATAFTIYDADIEKNLTDKNLIPPLIQTADKEEFDLGIFTRAMANADYKYDYWVLWKGCRLGVIRLSDGSEIYLAVSVYGSFFKILGEDGYYLIEYAKGG